MTPGPGPPSTSALVGLLCVIALAACTSSGEPGSVGDTAGPTSTEVDVTGLTAGQEDPAGSTKPLVAKMDPTTEIGPASVLFGHNGNCAGNGYFEAEKTDASSVRISAQATDNCDAISEVEFVLSQIDGQIIVSKSEWRAWSAHNDRDDAPVQPFESITLSVFNLDGVISGTIDDHTSFWTRVDQNPLAGPTQRDGPATFPEEPVDLQIGQSVWINRDCTFTLLDHNGDKTSILRFGVCSAQIQTEILDRSPQGTRILVSQNPS